MLKSFLIILAMISLSAVSSVAFSAQDASFIRWTSGTGTDVIDASGWHHCPRNTRGGNCGRRALRTGSSHCRGQGYSFGIDFEFPGQLVSLIGGKGFKLKGGRNYSWTTCNTRAESISCSPNRGYKGRAEIFRNKRRADIGFAQFYQSFGYGQSFWGDTTRKNLWWPTGYRYSKCTYRRL